MLAESFVLALAVAILAISEANGYVLVGIITAAFLLVGGIYTARINREVGKLDATGKRTESLQVGQASLIDDLQDDRAALRDEVLELRADSIAMKMEIDTLKIHSRETELALLNCRQHEIVLQERVAQLEAAL